MTEPEPEPRKHDVTIDANLLTQVQAQIAVDRAVNEYRRKQRAGGWYVFTPPRSVRL